MAVDEVTLAKATIRRSMRDWRRSLSDDELANRSKRIIGHLLERSDVMAATTVMGFSAVRGEPDLGPLAAFIRGSGHRWVVPEDDPEPTDVDLVIVPGVSFTANGDRLGQGGGWYDRFLPQRRAGVMTIGVCFAEQISATLPVEPHDVRVDAVVVDDDQVSS